MKSKKPKLTRASKSMMTSVERLTTAPERAAIIKSYAGKIIPVDMDMRLNATCRALSQCHLHAADKERFRQVG